ncbi:MAG: NAD(P)-dependent alcohol dehydrogenase [Isosphaeraceae bacterium]
MKAIVLDGYGGPNRLVLREIEPPCPSEGEVLLRVRAAGVNPVDWKIAAGDLRPFLPRRFPWIPGGDASGEVAQVGPGVTRFQEGDPVFCLNGAAGGGAYAELLVVSESVLAHKPPSLSFEEAAALPIAGLTALQALRDHGGLSPGGTVMIHGAAGGVGHLALQIAQALGASTGATCGPANLEFVRGLGADRVIDYTRDDFTRRGERYDVVFDAVGKRAYPACRRVLEPGGVYVSTLPSMSLFFWSMATRLPHPGARHRAAFVMVKGRSADLDDLAGLVEDGKLRPRLDAVYPLERAEYAQERSRSGHARGKIVLSVD